MRNCDELPTAIVTLLPLVLLLAFVFGYPLVRIFEFSFKMVRGIDGPWIGLRNYQLVLGQDLFWESVLHNLQLLLAIPAMVVISLIVSVLLGLAVMLMAAGRLTPQTVAANKVVVAAADLELGSKLNPQMLSVVDWPLDSTPAGTFADLKEIQDRVLKTSVQRGEVILGSKLAPVISTRQA